MEKVFRPHYLFAVTALALALLLSVGAWAQGAGDLTGVVTDPTGAVIPNVTVKLTNDATGAVRTTVSTGAGVYRFTNLPIVGTYALSVDAKGFKKVNVKGIVLSVGTTANQDLKLEVGQTSEVVTVEGGVQMVQTTDSQVSDLIDRRVWQQMPLEVRNQNQFINLVAGVTPNNQGIDDGGRGAAVNGARGGTGNFLVEGMDNNDQGQGGRGQISDASGGAATGISPDAIQEYRIITNSFNAEYGKAGGFVTDTVLKSGTNQYHGSLFEYNRVQALAANDFFSNRSTDPATGKKLQDALVRNQFGGSFGGALIKDKTFFFGSLEIHRMRQKSPTSTWGTTQQFLDWVNSGQFETFMETDPNGVCMRYNEAPCVGAFSHSSTLGSTFNALKAKGPFPLATDSASFITRGFQGRSDVGLNSFDYPVPTFGRIALENGYNIDQNRYSLKIDHKLGSNDQLNGTFLRDRSTQLWQYGGGDATIGPESTSPGLALNLGVNWTHTFSPTVLNTFKVSYLRHRADYPATKGYEGIPSIYTNDPLGVGFGMSENLPQFFTDNQFQYQDSMSITRGKHSFKAGFEYRRIRNGSSFEAGRYGNFVPWGIEDLVTDGYFGDELDQALFGEPAFGGFAFAEASVNPTTGGMPTYYRGFRANEFSTYFQDDFRINNRLTLNYGIRWEYFGPPHNFQPGIDSNFYFGSVSASPVVTTNPFFPNGVAKAAQVLNGGFQQTDHNIWNKDKNNFGPRFGLSWDILGNQKLVFRAGGGVMYDRIFNNLFENIRFNAPFFSFNDLGTYGSGDPTGPISTPGLFSIPFTPDNIHMFATGYSAAPSPRHMDQNLVSPYYEQFHAGFQYEVRKGYVVDTEYVGTMGHKLTGIVDINTYDGRVACPALDPATDDPYPASSACALAGYDYGFSSRRINRSIGADNYRSNGFSSNYHALQMTLKKSFGNGLQFNTNYTWSKALDTLSDSMAADSRQGGYRVTDNWNQKLDYGPADFDMRHRWITSLSYDLPFLKQNKILGGWSVNTIIELHSGVGFSPYDSNSDQNQDGYRTDRLTYLGGGNNPNSGNAISKFADEGNTVSYFTTGNWGVVACPATVNQGLWCNNGVSRNAMRGPGFFNADLGLNKKFNITERVGLTFSGNFFNVFNHASFALPVSNLGNPDFGNISATANRARITQLALRLDF